MIHEGIFLPQASHHPSVAAWAERLAPQWGHRVLFMGRILNREIGCTQWDSINGPLSRDWRQFCGQRDGKQGTRGSGKVTVYGSWEFMIG
jgi:hypothetical protein